MDLAIILGGASALLYGLTDFVARFANRESGVLRTMAWGQSFLAIIMTVVLLAAVTVPERPLADWLLLCVANLTVVGGTACLYRGLAVGKISVVAPLMACYGAVSALLSIMTGEKITAGSAAALALTVVGAILSASNTKNVKDGKHSGWQLALGSALLYGVGFWFQGKYAIPAFGPIVALWTYYLTASATVAVICLVRRQDMRFRSLKSAVLVLGTATLAGLGYAALVAGQTTGEVAIVTALSAASTAITVLLAFFFLHEKPGIKRGIGVMAVAGGVALLHLASKG